MPAPETYDNLAVSPRIGIRRYVWISRGRKGGGEGLTDVDVNLPGIYTNKIAHTLRNLIRNKHYLP